MALHSLLRFGVNKRPKEGKALSLVPCIQWRSAFRSCCVLKMANFGVSVVCLGVWEALCIWVWRGLCSFSFTSQSGHG